MYSRSKNTKDKFIGRRTGRNVLPGKTVRKREDGKDMFKDYFTDSENERSKDMIYSSLESKKDLSDDSSEEGNSNKFEKSNNNDVTYTTVVTDLIQIETKEVVYDDDEFAMECQNSFNKIITIHHNEEQNDERMEIGGDPFPEKLNETHVIKHNHAVNNETCTIQNDATGAPKSAMDGVCSPKGLNIILENSTHVENNFLSYGNSDASSLKLKSATFDKEDASPVQRSLNNGPENNEVAEDILAELNKTFNCADTNKRSPQSDASNSSESRENDASKALKQKNDGRLKAVPKTKSRKKNKTQDAPLSEQQVSPEDNFNILQGNCTLEPIPEANIPEKELVVEGLDNQQNLLQDVENIRALKRSSNSNKDVSQSLNDSQKKKKKKSKKSTKNSGSEVGGKDKISRQTEGDAPANCRRSTRQRCAPLKFWSNERLQYRYTKSGNIECLGVVRDSKSDELAFDKMAAKKKRLALEKVPKKQHCRPPQAHSYIDKGILVVDNETKEEVYVNAVIPYDNLLWRSPKQEIPMQRYEIGKSYMMDHAAHGFLRLKPMQTKPLQYIPGYNAVFVVITGKVEVIINRTPVIVSEKDTFFIPKGNPYSVTNLLDSEALLTFMASNYSYLDELKKTD